MSKTRALALGATLIWILAMSTPAIAQDMVKDHLPTQDSAFLAHLMKEADLIIVGSNDRLPEVRGKLQLTQLTVSRVLASVWSWSETEKSMSRTGAGHSSILVLESLPFTEKNRCMLLLSGGKYLLWLKSQTIPPKEDAGLPRGVIPFSVIDPTKGAILLSDPVKLDSYSALMARAKSLGTEQYTPFAIQERTLKNSFSGATPEALLHATGLLAWAMSQEDLGRAVLSKLSTGQDALLSSSATQLVKLPKIARFKLVEF